MSSIICVTAINVKPNPSLQRDARHARAHELCVSRLVSADFHCRVNRASAQRKLVVVQALSGNLERGHHLSYLHPKFCYRVAKSFHALRAQLGSLLFAPGRGNAARLMLLNVSHQHVKALLIRVVSVNVHFVVLSAWLRG